VCLKSQTPQTRTLSVLDIKKAYQQQCHEDKAYDAENNDAPTIYRSPHLGFPSSFLRTNMISDG
jgi:hypothetical protein